MLDNQCNSLDNQESPHINQALWMNFSSADMNSQWKTCSQASIKWVHNGALVGFEYGGAASIALSVTGTAQDADNYQPNNKFFSSAEVERVLGELLRGMEIKPYPNYPALLDAAMLSYEKMQPDKKLSLAFQGDQLLDCLPYHERPPSHRTLDVSEEWEDAITYGILRRASPRLAGMNERLILVNRGCYAETPYWSAAAAHEISKGRLDQDIYDTAKLAEDDDDYDYNTVRAAISKVVRVVCAALGNAASLPTCFATNPSAEDHVDDIVDALLEGDSDQFDGDSKFMRAMTPNVVAAVAPTLQLILFDAYNAGELNGHIVELAAACPKDTVKTDTKSLFTAAGIGGLERYMSTFSAWAGSDTALGLHIRHRVSKLIERVAAHTNSGADASHGSFGAATGDSGPTVATAGYFDSAQRVNMAQLSRVREAGDNPAIITDLLKMLAIEGCDPLGVIRVCLTGKTTKHPDRDGTPFTRLLGLGILNGARIDPRLSIITEWSKGFGGQYIGQLVGDVLLENHMVEEEGTKDLRFDALWEALRGRDWKTKLDLYNQLLVELHRQGPCGGGMRAANIKAIPTNLVWKDVINNHRLPMLIAAIFEGLGIPHQGPESLPVLLSGMNDFISYHGGVSPAATAGACA
jgi:hypothetical protein